MIPLPTKTVADIADREARRSHAHDGPSAAEDFLSQCSEAERLMLEAEIDRRAFHVAAGVVAEIGRRLTGYSTYSAAVACALHLHDTDGGTLTEIGARMGVTKQAVENQMRDIRHLFVEARPAYKMPEVIRPSEPGTWLTRPEMFRQFRIEGPTADRWGARSVEVGGIRFWERTEVERLLLQQTEVRRRRQEARKRREAEAKAREANFFHHQNEDIHHRAV